MLLAFDPITWRNEPYRIGLAKPVMEQSLYERLVSRFPDESLLLRMGQKGYAKLALSERAGPNKYAQFVQSSALWSKFHAYIKSRRFLETIDRVVGLGRGGFRARWEFSSMPADGGGIDPHTDIVSKVVTLIIPMLKSGDWDPAWGGGTDVLRPTDASKILKDYEAPLSAFEKVATYDYAPNQACVFIKSTNSWHSVGPIRGPAGKWRRTLTINIERAT